MARTELIEHLNRALSYELAGAIQYAQHSFLTTGIEREIYRKFFREQSEEAHEHTYMVGDKIISLGGIPTTEPVPIQQSVNLSEMLQLDLELERAALAAYMAAWENCEEEKTTQFWLEERMAEEQLHVEELEKICRERVVTLPQERMTLRQVS